MPVHLLTDVNVSALIDALDASERVALDTEFHAERRYEPQLWLVQVALPSGDVWLIDPAAVVPWDRLASRLLSRPWIVHAGYWDLRLLLPRLGALPDVIYDTQIASGLTSTRHPTSLAALSETYLGQPLDKGETLSDWSQRPLTPQQTAYAAADAALLLPLWDKLATAANERLHTVRLACDEARAHAIARSSDVEPWRAIAGHEHLDERARNVLIALLDWREGAALDANSPARAIMTDGIVLDLARRQPTSEGELLSSRRFPKSVGKRHGKQILAAVVAGQRAPLADAPVTIAPYGQHARQRLVVQALIAQLAEQAQWAPRLVTPPALVDRLTFAWGDQLAIDKIQASAGWRTPLLEPAYEALQHDAITLRLTLADAAAR